MRRNWIWAFPFLLFPLPVLCGHIILHSELEVTIPGFADNIEQVKFNDIEGDGIPEILACDGNRLVLYSVTGDSIIMSEEIVPGYFNYLILFDNINLDSVPDVVLGTYRCGSACNASFPAEPESCQVMLFDGSAGFQKTGTKTYSWEQYSFVLAPTGIRYLGAADLNDDGSNELVISIDRIFSRMDIGVFNERTDGITEAYADFPDEKTHERAALVTGYWQLSDQTSTPLFITDESYERYNETGPDQFNSDRYSCLRDNTGEFLQRVESPVELSCSFWEWGEFHRTTNHACHGNLVVGWGGTDVLFTYSGSNYCVLMVASDSAIVTSKSESGQQLYRLIGTDSLQLVWENDEQYSNYVYHPLFPGYYLAFGGTNLYQFRGIDGSRHQAVGNLPSGRRWWDYPYDDEIPRLIVVSGQTVKIFTLDISTDAPIVTENESLPKSFVLSDPYPNPFNAEVTIPIHLNAAGHLRVTIYNMLGQRVATLHDRLANSGELVCSWNASEVASGMYVVDVRMGDERDSRRIQFVK